MEAEPRPLTCEKRSNSRKKAISYDPTTQNLVIKDESVLAGAKELTKIPVPKFGKRMPVHLPGNDSETPSYVGTVYLNKLGMMGNIMRHFGKYSYLYVVHLPEEN